jgi:hypothetical protein
MGGGRSRFLVVILAALAASLAAAPLPTEAAQRATSQRVTTWKLISKAFDATHGYSAHIEFSTLPAKAFGTFLFQLRAETTGTTSNQKTLTEDQGGLFTFPPPATDLSPTVKRVKKTNPRTGQPVFYYTVSGVLDTGGDLGSFGGFHDTFSSSMVVRPARLCGGSVKTLTWRGRLSGVGSNANVFHANDPGQSFFPDPIGFNSVGATLIETLDSSGGQGCTPPPAKTCTPNTQLGIQPTTSNENVDQILFRATNETLPSGDRFTFDATVFETLRFSPGPGHIADVQWSVLVTTPDTSGLTAASDLSTATLDTANLGVAEVSGKTTYTATAPAGSPGPVAGCAALSTVHSTGDLSAPITVTFNGAGPYANDPSGDTGQQVGTLSQRTSS